MVQKKYSRLSVEKKGGIWNIYNYVYRLMNKMTAEGILEKFAGKRDARRNEFYRYYSSKRIQHQLKQLDILRNIPAKRVTEIGSYLGFATALFMAAGYEVQTIDAGQANVLGEIKPSRHIPKNIRDVSPEDLFAQDIVVCCETLEHLYFDEVQRVLSVFRNSGIEWLLVSVPCRCMSVDIRISRNPYSSFFSWIVKFPTRKFREFLPDPEPDGHKWELGYKGYPIKKMTDALSDSGFRVEKIDYVGTVQSVFFLARRRER